MKRRDFIRWSMGAGALVMLEMAGLGCSRDRSNKDLPIKLPPLPYANDALEPHLSRETIQFHYDRHHRAYVERANRLLADSSLAKQPIEAIMRETYQADSRLQTARFNNAAQAYNHAFYWSSMAPDGGGPPAEFMQRWIDDSFGSYQGFKQAFVDAARGHFASGWIWLVLSEGRLEIMATTNAQNPIVLGKLPLLTLDVWEHAYYLDYRHRRDEYVQAFLDHLVNWNFAAANLGEA
ncbi:MAG: superoxide dismutase [Desulfobacterales bacterium]|nr:superoxide dismutase [Desulfobacterales bacterium]